MLTPRLPKPKCPDIVIILVRRSRLEKHRGNGLIASASTDGLIASASTEGKAIRRWQGYNYYQSSPREKSGQGSLTKVIISGSCGIHIP